MLTRSSEDAARFRVSGRAPDHPRVRPNLPDPSSCRPLRRSSRRRSRPWCSRRQLRAKNHLADFHLWHLDRLHDLGICPQLGSSELLCHTMWLLWWRKPCVISLPSPSEAILTCFAPVAIDLTILAESIPSNWTWVLCGLASIWGLGNTVAGLIGTSCLPLISTSDSQKRANHAGCQ